MYVDLVAIDLETSGLDADKDAIIEIGAVRIRNGQIIDTFSTLINPGFAIPNEITQLTGIRQEDLRHAPALADVLPQLTTFVADAVLLAHNAPFDMAFLRKASVLKSNTVLDTLEMASILLPKALRYGLGNLAASFDISLENAHRALADAEATALLYWQLWEKARQLPKPLLKELANLGESLRWDMAYFFAQAHDHSPNNTLPITEFAPLPIEDATLMLEPIQVQMDASTIATLFSSTGQLANQLTHYEERPQQTQMAQKIIENFQQHQHLVVEAGTGVGKSLAYLIPAAQWSIASGQRVVIATNTLNLQDQLLNKDVPVAQQALNTPFRARLLKGKNNYLCPRRLNIMRQRATLSLDELRLLAKILVWLQESQTGYKSDITLRGLENAIWARFSADDEQCHTHSCQSLMAGTCPFHKARQQAETAHVIIVNHALLTSDIGSQSQIIPHYDYLIIDEAHNFEESVTNGLSVRIEQIMVLRTLNEYSNAQKGALPDIQQHVTPHLSEKQRERMTPFLTDIQDVVTASQKVVRHFFLQLREFAVTEHSIGNSNSNLRFTDKLRRHKSFASVLDSQKHLEDHLTTLVEATQQLIDFIHRVKPEKNSTIESLLSILQNASTFLSSVVNYTQQCTQKPDANQIYWFDYHDNPDFMALQIAPLNIGTIIETHLWQEKKSVILTSATLQTQMNYSFVTERLALQNIQTLTLDSPFDYKDSALLYIPQDMPDLNAQKANYQRAVERAIVELATTLEGRVLVLFTSYAQLRETAQNITPRLALGNISVHDQSFGANRETLLEGFKTTTRAVLLGTKSFWQGVDIPGNDLLGLVIVRLPFTVPNDPVFAARSETYQSAFDEYAVPEAVLRFRQGFGRLIRTQRDKGVVAVLDGRIVSKSYGKTFIESLPDCTVKYGSIQQLAHEAKAWLHDIITESEET